MRHRPGRAERGSAIVELVWLGILLLVPLLWIVLSVSEVQQGAFGVTAAARSAGRAYALAPDDASGRRAAEEVARRALADQGLEDAPVRVAVTCTPYPHDCHNGTSVITVRIRSSSCGASGTRCSTAMRRGSTCCAPPAPPRRGS